MGTLDALRTRPDSGHERRLRDDPALDALGRLAAAALTDASARALLPDELWPQPTW